MSDRLSLCLLLFLSFFNEFSPALSLWVNTSSSKTPIRDYPGIPEHPIIAMHSPGLSRTLLQVRAPLAPGTASRLPTGRYYV